MARFPTELKFGFADDFRVSQPCPKTCSKIGTLGDASRIMDKSQFLLKVQQLRDEGLSIRAIGAKLGVHRNRVHRALNSPAIKSHPIGGTELNLSHVRGESRFVGRQREMDILKASLEDVLSGNGRILMLAGEPGIGKTSLVQEFALNAEREGIRALWGRCHEGRGAPPYWPWIDLIRPYIENWDSDELRTELGHGAYAIANIFPEIREKLPYLKPARAPEDPSQARFQSFDAFASFLKNCAKSKPMLLVLDDLQWADTTSLLLMEFLAKELTGALIFIVGIYRITEVDRVHPLSETLGRLSGQSSYGQISLEGLSSDEVKLFVELSTGQKYLQNQIDKVFDRTLGNPFFTKVVVDELVHDGTIDDLDNQLMAVPERIRDAIWSRLRRLSPECIELVTLASVFGREFLLGHLYQVSDVPSQVKLVELIEEALLAQIIETNGADSDMYQFTHDLIHHTVYDELSPARKAGLHARIAEALVEIHGSEAEVHAPILARHFARAKAVIGTENLARYLAMTGGQALASFAFVEALSHFEAALEAKEEHSISANETQVANSELAAILFGLGKAQVATYARARAQEAVDTFRRAFDAFLELGDVKNAVAVATYPHGFLRSSTGAANMASRALDLVPPDSLEAGYLLSIYGAALSWENKDYQRAQETLSRAVEIARKEGDRTLEVRTLIAIGQMFYDQGHNKEAAHELVSVIELAKLIDDLETLAHARIMYANVLLTLGDFDNSLMHATAGLEEAGLSHNIPLMVALLRHNAHLAMLTGNFELARQYVSLALDHSPEDVAALADATLLALQVGDLPRGDERIEQLSNLVSGGLIGTGTEQSSAAAIITLYCRVTGSTDLLDVAESASRAVLSSPSSATVFAVRARIGLSLVAIQRLDKGLAQKQYSFLKPHAGSQIFAIACCDRILGLLAQTLDNANDAKVHFQDAVAFGRNAGYRTELAWSLCDFATFLVGLGQHDQALSLADEAEALSIELGIRPVSNRVDALRKDVAKRSIQRSTPPQPVGLTEREMDVLQLIARGQTTREIAEELSISPRTVQRHTTNLYTKINVRNRAEATAFALNELGTDGQIPKSS